ncbi:MAG: hypothetical protein FWF71_04105 [Actinomycetia bacterium]|nr:hypothetical protein [Actinomycetes bacterium]
MDSSLPWGREYAADGLCGPCVVVGECTGVQVERGGRIGVTGAVAHGQQCAEEVVCG